MIEKSDFKFRDDMYDVKKGETVPIEILIEPYKNVIIRYTRVSVKEQDNGTAMLQFEYEVLKSGEYSETSLRKDKRFEQHLGILLNHLILEAAEGSTDNADREDYSEESYEERNLHEKGSSVS